MMFIRMNLLLGAAGVVAWPVGPQRKRRRAPAAQVQDDVQSDGIEVTVRADETSLEEQIAAAGTEAAAETPESAPGQVPPAPAVQDVPTGDAPSRAGGVRQAAGTATWQSQGAAERERPPAQAEENANGAQPGEAKPHEPPAERQVQQPAAAGEGVPQAGAAGEGAPQAGTPAAQAGQDTEEQKEGEGVEGLGDDGLDAGLLAGLFEAEMEDSPARQILTRDLIDIDIEELAREALALSAALAERA